MEEYAVADREGRKRKPGRAGDQLDTRGEREGRGPRPARVVPFAAPPGERARRRLARCRPGDGEILSKVRRRVLIEAAAAPAFWRALPAGVP